MTPEERLKCIKLINPLAHCIVLQDGEKQWVKWDVAHVGVKPTLEECESVLAQARLEILPKKAIDRVQSFMDAKAKELGYDHILSASSYVTSTFPKFKAEGIAFAKWRDDVWLYCYSVLAEWEAGTSIITTEDELIASLPEFIVEY